MLRSLGYQMVLMRRYLAMASTRGHVAMFDWQAGRLSAEIQLRESVRDIK